MVQNKIHQRILTYTLNYTALIDKLKSDIELWRTIPMSMIGRINAIEMVETRSYTRANILRFETYNSPDEVYCLLAKESETKKLVSMFVNVFAAQTEYTASERVLGERNRYRHLGGCVV